VQPLHDAGLHSTALEHLECATRLDPGDPRLYLQAAVVLPLVFESEQQVVEIRATLRHTLGLARNASLTSTVYLSDLPAASLQLCYHGHNDRELIREITRTYAAVCDYLAPPEGFALPMPSADKAPALNVASHAATGDKDGAQRVVFVSAHFRWHSVCRVVCGTIEKLAETELHVAIALVPASPMDHVTQSLSESVDTVIHLPDNLDEAHRVLLAHGASVLVFTDVGMHPWSSNLAYRRSAPTQVAFWGHHGTSGLSHIDFYVVADGFEPDGAAFDKHTEQLVRLQNSGIGVYLKRTDFLPAHPKEGSGGRSAASRRALGIPESSNVYLIPQSLPKLHPRFDDAIVGVLLADPDGVVLVPADGHGQRGWLYKLQARLARRIPDTGAFTRLIFCPRVGQQDLWRLFELADVALDPFPVGGGITSLELIATATPVVTLPSAQTVIRTTGTAYAAIGMEQLSVADVESYVDLALRLGTDRNFNREIRMRLGAASEALFTQQEAVDEWADLIRRLAPWQ